MPSDKITQDEVLFLRQKVKNVQQHHDLQLIDVAPSLLEVMRLNHVNLTSLDSHSLFQIGFYILDGENFSDKTATDIFISQLTEIALSSIETRDSVDEENLILKCSFLLAVWNKKDKIPLQICLEERLESSWEQCLQLYILDLVTKLHSAECENENEFFDTLFTSSEALSFLNTCSQCQQIFQTTVALLASFLIQKKGCALIIKLTVEIVKRVQHRIQDKIEFLFPSKYENLVSHLRKPPDPGNDLILNLLIESFNEDKLNVLSLIMCFPLWLPCLCEYYEKCYGTSIFSKYYF